MRDNAAWTYMTNVLQGAKYEPHVCLLITDEVISTVGLKGDTHTHTLLTNRLYEPTAAERFAAK
jgi:hypothetical protein